MRAHLTICWLHDRNSGRKEGRQAIAKELFKPKYSPPGMRYADAKAQGCLRESQTYWIRLWHEGRPLRESTGTDDIRKAREFLKARKASLAKGEPIVKNASK